MAAVGEAHARRLAAGALGQRAGEGLDAGVERVAEAGRDADRDAGERGRVGHRVVGREVGRRRVRPGVGRPRLGVAGPDGRADRGGRADQVRELLRQQQGAVAAHRDAHDADAARSAAAFDTEAAAPAQRDHLVGEHRLRVVARVRIPVAGAAVDRHQRHRGQRRATDPERQRPGGRQAEQRVGVGVAVAVEHDHQRQFRARPVPGRVADRVADGAVPGPRVERAGQLRARRSVGCQVRRGHRARPVDRVERALAGQVPAADELGAADADGGGARHHGQTAAEEAPTGRERHQAGARRTARNAIRAACAATASASTSSAMIVAWVTPTVSPSGRPGSSRHLLDGPDAVADDEGGHRDAAEQAEAGLERRDPGREPDPPHQDGCAGHGDGENERAERHPGVLSGGQGGEQERVRPVGADEERQRPDRTRPGRWG